MIPKAILFILLFCSFNPVFAQPGKFISPLDTPLFLSAPFGSLRDNHFHSGMDIRTNERIGLPVFAIEDGYVSRIKIQSIGYGKAIYIHHANGLTSVYGHLDRYAGDIQTYIKSYQYQHQQFEIDHFPQQNKLLVKKGQIIGYSGNSGTSSGPHLHFEIRDSKSEQILNPLIFGFVVMDSLPPVISSIHSYNLNGQSPQRLYDYDLRYFGMLKTDSGFLIQDTILLSAGTSGIGIQATDYLVNYQKPYSIYSMSYSLDGMLRYKFALNRFAFDRTKCINAHIDYAYYKTKGERIQKMFLDDGNQITLYPFVRNKGKLTIHDTSVHLLKLSVSDFSGRTTYYYAHTKVSHIVQENTPATTELTITAVPGKTNRYVKNDLQLTIPENALFDTADLIIKALDNESSFSSTYQIGSSNIPLNKSFSVSLKYSGISVPDKLCMAFRPENRKTKSYAGGEISNGCVTGRSSQFGYFSLAIDSFPPVVRNVSLLPADSILPARIVWKAEDDFSGIQSYNLYMNGKWILCEYDAKNDSFEYRFDESTPIQSKVTFELILTDKKNNSTKHKSEFQLP